MNELTFGFASTDSTVKLEPHIRAQSTVHARSYVSLESLKPFLKTSLILDNKHQYSSAPYVISEDDGRLVGGPGSLLYVRGIKNTDELMYTVYKEGKSYCHPCTHELLGFEALAIGIAELQSVCDPTQFLVLKADESIEVGARLLPSFATVLPSSFTLRPAEATQEGYILSVRDGLGQIGKHQVVVVSLGIRERLEEGDVLDIYQTNRSVPDTKTRNLTTPCKIKLPDTRMGQVLIFQTFEKLSLGLILETYGPVHLLDKVRNP